MKYCIKIFCLTFGVNLSFLLFSCSSPAPESVADTNSNVSNSIILESENTSNVILEDSRADFDKDSAKSTTSSKELPENSVSENLYAELDEWSRLETKNYSPKTSLKTLWGKNNPPAKYDDFGAKRLRDGVMERDIFRNCNNLILKTQSLKDGTISTVGKLYEKLLPCEVS